jgi:thiamine-phosphate pyrophosphorylase
MIALPRLYAIADAQFGDPVQIAQFLLAGGARLIQVRYKNAGGREFFEGVQRVLAVAPADARIVVNDRVDVSLITGAAGVHLGQTDLVPTAARSILGADRIVGFSTHNLHQALEADRLSIDYIAVGPIFPTTSKQNPDPPVGLEGLAEISKAVHKPIVAIGGIKIERAKEVLHAGASCVAVIRDLLESGDIAARTRQWIRMLETIG